MEDGAVITGNTNPGNGNSSDGGGAYIGRYGTLTKTGGIIYGSNETGNDADGNPLLEGSRAVFLPARRKG
jgi:hypothetical protein